MGGFLSNLGLLKGYLGQKYPNAGQDADALSRVGAGAAPMDPSLATPGRDLVPAAGQTMWQGLPINNMQGATSTPGPGAAFGGAAALAPPAPSLQSGGGTMGGLGAALGAMRGGGGLMDAINAGRQGAAASGAPPLPGGAGMGGLPGGTPPANQAAAAQGNFLQNLLNGQQQQGAQAQNRPQQQQPLGPPPPGVQQFAQPQIPQGPQSPGVVQGQPPQNWNSLMQMMNSMQRPRGGY